MNVIRQFNQYSQNNKSLLQKALTSASGSGGALIPENLEKMITDTVIRLSPELALATTKKITGNYHQFNRLVRRPGRGGALGEGATTPSSDSRTARDSVQLKIVRRKGKVTNFLQDTSEEFIDVAAYEMENHIQAHILDLIYYMVWGNSSANPYEFSGLETFIKTNRRTMLGVPSDLGFLDSMIDSSNRRGGARHRRAFMMSPEMLSKVSSLLTNVRLNQGVVGNGITQVDVNGGWRLNAYRDIPIIETTSLKPIEAMSSTVFANPGMGGGSLSDGTYYVFVAPVTYEGEQAPGSVSSVDLTGGTSTQWIQVYFDAPHKSADYNGDLYSSALSYKVYIGTSPHIEQATLNQVVPAFTYDAEGAPSGDNGVVGSEISILSLTANSTVPTHMVNDAPLNTIGGVIEESVVLWDLDPIQGLGKMPFTNKAGDRFEGLVVTKPLAEIDDYLQFLIKSYTALVPSYEATSYWTRGLRTV